jgi:hypothetical protein
MRSARLMMLKILSNTLNLKFDVRRESDVDANPPAQVKSPLNHKPVARPLVRNRPRFELIEPTG